MEDHGTVGAVVGDTDTLAPTLAAVLADATGESVVVCPPGAAERVRAELNNHDWTATVRTVTPFDVEGVAAALADLDRAVLDPGLTFPLGRLSRTGPTVTIADVAVPPRDHRRLLGAGGLAARATLFGLAFGFYLLLGEPTAFDAVTGAVSAAVVAALLGRTTFARSPRLRRSLPRLLRAVPVLVYLVWAALRATASLAAVVLDPRLPVEPSVEVVPVAADSDLERAVLANAVTLTPGTVAVDVTDDELVVHALTPGSRRGLRAGDLQRAVRFVFAGRNAPGAEP